MSRALADQRCTRKRSTDATVAAETCQALMPPNWELDEHRQEIYRAFEFKDFHQVMAFANAVAWIAHSEDHHPTLTIEYRRCRVVFTTHVCNGLTMNDFICSAKVDRLLE